MALIKVSKPAMKLIGVGVDTSVWNASKDCMPLWMDFMKKYPVLKNVINPGKTYGVSRHISREACTFRYVASAEVSDFPELAGGIEKVEVPASDYLVFTHKGKLANLGETYARLTEEVAASGLEQSGFWIEAYDERWKNDSDDSEFDIWIPVK